MRSLYWGFSKKNNWKSVEVCVNPLCVKIRRKTCKKICAGWKLIERRVIIARDIYLSVILTRYVSCAMNASLLDRIHSGGKREMLIPRLAFREWRKKEETKHKLPAKQAPGICAITFFKSILLAVISRD